MSGRARTLLLAAMLAARLLPAQEDEASRRRLEELHSHLSGAYPSFVTGGAGEQAATPTATPATPAQPASAMEDLAAASDDATTASLPVELTVEAVLAAEDASTTETWAAVRARLEPAMDELRILILAAADSAEVRGMERELNKDLLLVDRLSRTQAPRREESVRLLTARIRRQLSLLVDDFAGGRGRAMENTDVLLRESTDQLLRLLELSDADQLLVDARPGAPPPDWQPGSFAVPGFRSEVQTWSAARLMDEYESRLHHYQRTLQRDRDYRDGLTLAEMGEIARELSQRTDSVPRTAAVAFRDTALRLDVLAENVRDYLEADDVAQARRQLRVMTVATRDVRAYLELE